MSSNNPRIPAGKFKPPHLRARPRSVEPAFSEAANTFNVQRDESVTLTDSQTGAWVTAAARGESVVLTDSQTGVKAFAGQTDESVTLTDSQTGVIAQQVRVTWLEIQPVSAGSTTAETVVLTDGQTVQAVFAVTEPNPSR